MKTEEKLTQIFLVLLQTLILFGTYFMLGIIVKCYVLFLEKYQLNFYLCKSKNFKQSAVDTLIYIKLPGLKVVTVDNCLK